MGWQSEVEWFIVRGGREHGSLTFAELSLFLAKGHAQPTDVFYHPSKSSQAERRYYTPSEIVSIIKNTSLAHQRPTGNSPTSSTNTPLTIIDYFNLLVSEPLAIITTIRNAFLYPSEFVQQKFEQRPKQAIRDALSFFFYSFSLAFVIFAAITHFSFYSGASEIRLLAKICLDLSIGIAILCAVMKIIYSAASLRNIILIVIYFDGLYLLFSSAAFAAAHTLATKSAIMRTGLEKDLYGNLFETCVSNKSLLYWLIRGDLEFYVNPTQDTISNLFVENSHYAIALLCLIVVTRIYSVMYKFAYRVFFLVASLTFILVTEGHSIAEEKAINYLAERHSSCWGEAAQTVARTYKREVITSQLLLHLQKEIKNLSAHGLGFVDVAIPTIIMDGANLHVRATFPSQVFISVPSELIEVSERFVAATYCNDHSYFRLARALEMRLHWVAIDETGYEHKSLVVAPDMCE